MNNNIPKTLDETIAWFCENDTHNENEIRHLLYCMINHKEEPLEIERTWSYVLNYGLLYKDSLIGWVLPNGKMLGAAYATHEKLIYWLGYEVRDIEEAGWVRVGIHDYKSKYKMTPQQVRKVKACGKLIDKQNERLKPHYKNANHILLPSAISSSL